MTAADEYVARIDAARMQSERLRDGAQQSINWDNLSAQFRLDPRRRPDRNLEAIAALVQPDDVVLDVGGGAGRIGLPLALKCRELVNVEPSPGMNQQFRESAIEAGITNVRVHEAEWLDADGVAGDVAIVANVTYFVRDIVPFVEKLQAATRRRVIINVWSVPPPGQDASLFELVYGEPQVIPPSYRELLPVLWDLDILPDVQLLPEADRRVLRGIPPTREDAIELATRRLALHGPPRPEVVAAHFDEIFAPVEEGFKPLWPPPARELLITWAPP